MDRVVHLIEHECETYIETLSQTRVRIRITERSSEPTTEFDANPVLLNPTSFEIEGNPEFILDAISSIFIVLSNMDATRKEPS